ncbi:MAG: phenylacetic acid degradation protein PaaY [Alphaproteobacteria bacterium]|nr:phenylacetic acid degradation protein PaaY [Alphaproteobacteria bacterium]
MPFYSIDGVVPVVDPTTFVHPTASLIGDVIVGPGCYIGPGASLRGDFGRIVMKAGSNFQDGCVAHSFPGMDAVMEESAHVGHGAVLHGCTVGRHALIGMNAVVMDGAVVGESAFVGAMTFIKAGFEVPARSLVQGVPGRVLRPLTQAEIDWMHEGTRVYQELARRSLASLRPVDPLPAPEPDRERLEAPSIQPLYQAKSGR